MGVILGTAAYMSPEQAKGKPVDKRADVWAFGAVLYEMLAGRRAFGGDDVAEVMAAVIRAAPAFDTLPTDTPPAIRRLLHRCFQKDLSRRLRDVGDATIEIDDVTPDDGDRVASARLLPLWQRTRQVVVGVAAGAVIAFVALTGWGRYPQPSTSVTSLVADVSGESVILGLAVSPDGRQVVYARANNGLYLRPLSAFEATPIAGTEGVSGRHLVFSPDGQTVAFAIGRTLRRVPVTGGVAVAIGEVPGDPTGISWTGDFLLVAVGNQGIVRVPANGGSPELLVTLDAGEHAAAPQLMPGGESVLFTLAFGSPSVDWSDSQVVLQSLVSDERDVIVAGSDGWYHASGHITYAVAGIWFAAAFDVDSLRVVSPPVSMIEGVARLTNRGLLEPGVAVKMSPTGVVAYLPGPATLARDFHLIVTDRDGQSDVLDVPPGPYESPRVSPDGGQLAVSTDDGQESAVWVYDMSGQSALRRLTFAGRNRYPVWSPDGQRLAFLSDREGDAGIFAQVSDGTSEAERLTRAEPGAVHIPESWSSDGRYLSFSVLSDSGAELWFHSLADGRSESFGDVRASTPLNSSFSPDGRWIAYTVRTGGDTSVFLQPVPATGARYQVSTGAGHHPFWAPDGTELFYFGVRLVSVPITLSPTVQWGEVVRVPGGHPSNTTPEASLNYGITPDGLQFVYTRLAGPEPAGAAPSTSEDQLRVILNWDQELLERVPIP